MIKSAVFNQHLLNNFMTQLNNKQINHLKSLAHHLKPVVIIGEKGLSENVLDEINQALKAHELIKIKIRAQDRQTRQITVETIIQQTKACKVQQVGHVVSIFKRSKELLIALPK